VLLLYIQDGVAFFTGNTCCTCCCSNSRHHEASFNSVGDL